MITWYGRTLKAERFVKVIDVRRQETVRTPAEGRFTATSILMIIVVIALFTLVRKMNLKKYFIITIIIFCIDIYIDCIQP